MMVLVTYDIGFSEGAGANRLRRIAKVCLDNGVRAQYSVFECEVTPDQWAAFKQSLLDIYNPETDSLRFYILGKNWRHKVEHHGAKPAIDIFKDVL